MIVNQRRAADHPPLYLSRAHPDCAAAPERRRPGGIGLSAWAVIFAAMFFFGAWIGAAGVAWGGFIARLLEEMAR